MGWVSLTHGWGNISCYVAKGGHLGTAGAPTPPAEFADITMVLPLCAEEVEACGGTRDEREKGGEMESIILVG